MKRLAAPLAALLSLAAGPALADPGHAAAAGLDHRVAGIAVALAVATSLWGLGRECRKGRRRPQPEAG